MSRQYSKAEGWSSVYKAYQHISFTSYDYDTVKRSLIDYIRTYHPENFNDFIENSELVAIIESFAYISHQLAYRQDMNAQENFISTAQRKQSVLKLARYVSYRPNRNIAPRGLVKLTSVQTTEEVYDVRGTNLANKKVQWNDPNNSSWKDQFFTVMNRVLDQRYGSVSPNDRVQFDDTVFELYRLKNRPFPNGVITYTVTTNGQRYPMELVPVELAEDGPIERRPAFGSPFSVLYVTSGQGDFSESTGFFCFTKQGTLNRIRAKFDGVTPNLTFTVDDVNINDTDVWVNQINPDTGLTDRTPVLDPLGRPRALQGEWVEVDTTHVENIIYNTNINRNKYEIETLENDAVRLMFGDGEFADIPSGTFDVWYRTSNAGDAVIPKNSVINKISTVNYVDGKGKLQTLTFTFSLLTSLSNGAKSEDIERIRKFAPSVYYTQDRMVNGRDYNSYPLQDQSIVKLRAINRTFAGDSKYMAWKDPSEFYDNVKIFGDDMSLYYSTDGDYRVAQNLQPLTFIRTVVEPILEHVGIHSYLTIQNKPLPIKRFTVEEMGTLDVSMKRTIMGELAVGMMRIGDFTVYLNYEPVYDLALQSNPIKWKWVAYDDYHVMDHPDIANESAFKISYNREQQTWRVDFKTTHAVAYSPTTKFWFNNGYSRTLVSDTLNTKYDEIVLLRANEDATRRLLNRNIHLNVLGAGTTTIFPDASLQEPNSLRLMSGDENYDGIPDDVGLGEILHEEWDTVVTPDLAIDGVYTIMFPDNKFWEYAKMYHHSFEVLVNGRTFTSIHLQRPVPNEKLVFTPINENGELAEPEDTVRGIRLNFNPIESVEYDYQNAFNEFIGRSEFNLRIIKRRYSYFYKDLDSWLPATHTNVEAYAKIWDYQTRTRALPDERTVTRFIGLNDVNFAWFHRTPRYHIIDPSVTNIVDMFAITRGYYSGMVQWVRGDVSDRPIEPTPIQLKTAYQKMIQSKMISDSIVIHSGKFKILFGEKADPLLRAKFKVIQTPSSRLTANELKLSIIEIIHEFFNVDYWEFGETFYFTELASAIHEGLPTDVDSVVIVPESSGYDFGTMFQVNLNEDEMWLPHVDLSDIMVIENLTSHELRQ